MGKRAHFVTDLLPHLNFPELIIDAENASASKIQGHSGRVCIIIPLKSDPKIASEIFKDTGIAADWQKKHLSFATEADSCEAAAQKANAILRDLQALSSGIAEDSESIKAEILGLVNAEIDTEEQEMKNRQRQNEELTSILIGK